MSPPSAHTDRDLPILALHNRTSDSITHNGPGSPSTTANDAGDPPVGGTANDVQLDLDGNLKRRYLSCLPLAKVIDICLSLDAHVPAAIRETTWPQDFEAVIAVLSSPPETKEGKSAGGDAKDDDEGGPTLMAVTSTSSTTVTEDSTMTPATVPPVPPTPYRYTPQPYAYPPYFPATQPYFPVHHHPMPPHPAARPPLPSPAPQSAPPSHASPPPSVSSLHHPLPPLPVVPPHPQSHEDLPSYEEMIALALSEIDITGEGAAPKTLFNWMAAHYPLQTNFRPSASQALQKAYKRGRLEKSGGGRYRLNAAWEGGATSKRATRRPQTSAAATSSSTTTITPHAHAQGIAQPTTSRRPSPAPLFTQTPLSLTQRSSSTPSQHHTPQSHGTYTFSSYQPPGASAVKAESSTAGAGGGGDAENMDLDASTWEAAQAILRAINFGLGNAGTGTGGDAVDADATGASAAGGDAENATTTTAGPSPTTITFAPPIIPTPAQNLATLNGYTAPPLTMLSLTQQHAPSPSTPTFQFSSPPLPPPPQSGTSSTTNAAAAAASGAAAAAPECESESESESARRQHAMNVRNEEPGNGRAALQAHLALLAAQLAEIAQVGECAVREALGEVGVGVGVGALGAQSSQSSLSQSQPQLSLQTTSIQPRPREMQVDEGDQTDDGDEDVEMEAVVPPVC